MSNVAIGIRFSEQLLRQLERVAREENSDKSTLVRQFVAEHLKEYALRKACRKYGEGRISLSGAAREAGATVHEVLDCLKASGFRSEYSLEDLRRELNLVGV